MFVYAMWKVVFIFFVTVVFFYFEFAVVWLCLPGGMCWRYLYLLRLEDSAMGSLFSTQIHYAQLILLLLVYGFNFIFLCVNVCELKSVLFI